jgi:hypothetical protein
MVAIHVNPQCPDKAVAIIRSMIEEILFAKPSL